MTPESDLESLNKLLTSRGWALVQAALQDDILKAALAMAKSASMPVDEMHFRRGAIHAAASLANVPLVLKAQLETEIRLSQRPAKAGPKE